jgi:hypothetical protein
MTKKKKEKKKLLLNPIDSNKERWYNYPFLTPLPTWIVKSIPPI